MQELITSIFEDKNTPRLVNRFDAWKRPAYEMAISKHPEFPDLYLVENSLWEIGRKDLSAFWRTYDDILAKMRFSVVIVNYTTTKNDFQKVINYEAEGELKQETVYIPCPDEGEKMPSLLARANDLFAARYGVGAFKTEYWFGVVKHGDDLWIKHDSIILQ